jgi:uncharacterized membrane protein
VSCCHGLLAVLIVFWLDADISLGEYLVWQVIMGYMPTTALLKLKNSVCKLVLHCCWLGCVLRIVSILLLMLHLLLAP